MTNQHQPRCTECGETYALRRYELGYDLCMTCGEETARIARASWCVAQLYSKGNYQLVTDLQDLTRTNPKRTM